jgi:hypothetical protein
MRREDDKGERGKGEEKGKIQYSLLLHSKLKETCPANKKKTEPVKGHKTKTGIAPRRHSGSNGDYSITTQLDHSYSCSSRQSQPIASQNQASNIELVALDGMSVVAVG